MDKVEWQQSEVKMLTDYIHSAMKRATYEILEDGTYYGEIPELQGVFVNQRTLEDPNRTGLRERTRMLQGVFVNQRTLEGCRTELKSGLEGWILLGLQLGHPLPIVEQIDLNQREMAV